MQANFNTKLNAYIEVGLHVQYVVDSAFKILDGDLICTELIPGNSRNIYLPWFGKKVASD